MRIKLDANLPLQIATKLKTRAHDVHTADEEGLSGRSDEENLGSSATRTAFLITQDLDFSDRRRFAPGTHHGILLIRLHSPSRLALIQRVEGLFQDEDVNSWAGCFVVASERKLRVRSPLPSGA